jgi:uncharacterized protein (DUF433 family)
MDFRDYITMEPGKMGGRPCVRGMRFPVDDVLGYLQCMTEAEFLDEFPDLTPDDIRACREYAAHRERVTVRSSPTP